MSRQLINLILLLSVLTFVLSNNVIADEMMDNAQKYVGETWKNVDAHAKYMSIVDLKQATNQILKQSDRAGLAPQEQDAVLKTLSDLEAKSSSIGSLNGVSADQAKKLLLDQLNQLSEVTRQKYTLSWQMMDWDTYRSQAKAEVKRVILKYNEQCSAGHIEPGMTFQNTSPEIPAMSYDFSVTYTSGAGTSLNGHATPGNGTDKATEERRNYMGAAVTVIGAINPIAGVVAAVIGVAVELFMSSEEQNSLIERGAEAAAYLANNRAKTQDIVTAYRKQCAALGTSLNVVSEMLSLEGEAGAKVLAEAKSEKFQQEYQAWRTEMDVLHFANCRTNLAKKVETMGCPSDKVAINTKPNYVDDPMCSIYGAGCLKIASYSDSFCRTLEDGTVRDLSQGCEIAPTVYKNSDQMKQDSEIVAQSRKSNEDQKTFAENQTRAGKMAAMLMLLNLENSENFKAQYRQLEASVNQSRKRAVLRLHEMVTHIASDSTLNLINSEILLNREFEKLRGRYVQLTARTIRALVSDVDRPEIARDIYTLMRDADAFFKRTGWLFYKSSFDQGLQFLVGALR